MVRNGVGFWAGLDIATHMDFWETLEDVQMLRDFGL